MSHTKEQDASALAWIKKEFGESSGQVKGAQKVGPANWILREYGKGSGQYKKHVMKQSSLKTTLREFKASVEGKTSATPTYKVEAKFPKGQVVVRGGTVEFTDDVR